MSRRWFALFGARSLGPIASVMALAAGLALAGSAALALAQQPAAWPMFQGGPDHTGDGTGLAPAAPLKGAWRTRSPDGRPEPLSGLVVAPGAAIAVSPTHVVAFDPETGAEVWSLSRARAPLIALTTPAVDPVAGDHGVVVYTEGDAGRSAVIAVDLSTRKQLWKVALKKPSFGSPAIAGNQVLFGSQDQFLYAVDLLSGNVVWKRKLDGEVNGSPAVDGDNVVVSAEVTGGGRARLYDLDLRTGQVLWSVSQLGGTGVSTATLGLGAAYVGFPDHTFRAFDLRTGVERWSQPTRGGFAPVLAAALSNGAVYAADADGAVYRFDAQTGHRNWVFQFPDLSYGASPLVEGQFVYLTSRDGTIGAVDVTNGTLAWKTQFTDPALALTPDGDQLLASFAEGQGGMAAFRHDPAGTLTSEDSPTTMHYPLALASFGVAFVVLTLAILTAFRLLSPDRRRDSDRQPDERDEYPSEPVEDGEG